ncbi:hypothetical protein ACA106_00325 [Agrobacterium pusense]|uniref:hypothetical protein n=1 Tax=Agrobacterium pusense TaxID=648995 RepID=UPI001F3FEC2A|nr:hypothetical protein [Agrobacterium pusense]
MNAQNRDEASRTALLDRAGEDVKNRRPRHEKQNKRGADEQAEIGRAGNYRIRDLVTPLCGDSNSIEKRSVRDRLVVPPSNGSVGMEFARHVDVVERTSFSGGLNYYGNLDVNRYL